MNKRVLVIGCGTGRECKAFIKFGAKTFGTDINPQMIDQARQMDGISRYEVLNLTEDNFSLPGDFNHFDFIFFTWGIPNHIPSTKLRIAWLKYCKSLLTQGGRIILYPDVDDFSKTVNRFSLGSLIMSLKAKYYEFSWEEGDSLRSFLGNHNPSHHLAYYHYYPTTEHLLREATKANLSFTRLTKYAFELS